MSEAGSERMVLLARSWSHAQPIVGAVIAGAVVDFHDAEDLLAEVAETVVRKFDQYDPTRPFVPWAVGIARKQVLRYYERRSAVRQAYFDEPALRALEAAHLDLASELPAQLTALRRCIDSLRGKARQVLEMRYLHDLKPDAIADALRMKRNAVWVTLHRVRNALRDCIDRSMAAES